MRREASGLARLRPGMRGLGSALLVPSAPPGTPNIWTRASGISGSPVDSISDDGAAGGSFTGSGTARPAQTTIGGKTCPLFDGVNNFLASSFTFGSSLSMSAYTFASVFRADALSDASAPSNVGAQLFESNNGWFFPMCLRTDGLRAGHNHAGNILTSAIGISAGTLYVMLVTYDGTTIRLTCMGSTVSAAAGTIGGGAGDLLWMGKSADTTTFQQGALCEVVAYNTALSTADQATLTAYLRGRFPTAT